MPSTRARQVTRALGALALVAVPCLFAGLLIAPLVAFTRVGPVAGGVAATLGGVVTAVALGPVVVDRRVASLPRVGPNDDRRSLAESRVAAIAAQLGVDRPAVTVAAVDAVNVAVTDGHRGSRLVVTTRLLSLPPSSRDAAIRHAIARLQRREAAVTTAALPGLVAVETRCDPPRLSRTGPSTDRQASQPNSRVRARPGPDPGAAVHRRRTARVARDAAGVASGSGRRPALRRRPSARRRRRGRAVRRRRGSPRRSGPPRRRRVRATGRRFSTDSRWSRWATRRPSGCAARADTRRAVGSLGSGRSSVCERRLSRAVIDPASHRVRPSPRTTDGFKWLRAHGRVWLIRHPTSARTSPRKTHPGVRGVRSLPSASADASSRG